MLSYKSYALRKQFLILTLVSSALFWSYGTVGPVPTLFKEPNRVNFTVPFILDFIRHCPKNNPPIICTASLSLSVQYFLASTYCSALLTPTSSHCVTKIHRFICLHSFTDSPNSYWVSILCQALTHTFLISSHSSSPSSSSSCN